jgi:hypothetical protein
MIMMDVRTISSSGNRRGVGSSIGILFASNGMGWSNIFGSAAGMNRYTNYVRTSKTVRVCFQMRGCEEIKGET